LVMSRFARHHRLWVCQRSQKVRPDRNGNAALLYPKANTTCFCAILVPNTANLMTRVHPPFLAPVVEGC
jgi:hypothetical protein